MVIYKYLVYGTAIIVYSIILFMMDVLRILGFLIAQLVWDWIDIGDGLVQILDLGRPRPFVACCRSTINLQTIKDM